jgi:hypothetical protein
MFAVNGCPRLIPVTQSLIFWPMLLSSLLGLNVSECAFSIRHCTICPCLLVTLFQCFLVPLSFLLVLGLILLLGKGVGCYASGECVLYSQVHFPHCHCPQLLMVHLCVACTFDSRKRMSNKTAHLLLHTYLSNRDNFVAFLIKCY